MRPGTLDLLRCPYCGGRLELVTAMPHESDSQSIVSGVIACHCCLFPVVSGIPVMHLTPESVAAREALEAGDPDRAFRALVAPGDEAAAARFHDAANAPDATYREVVDTLGADIEGGYFLYRFSDPSFVVADAVIRAVGGTVLEGGGRAIDLCGGSGHLTRSLLGLSAEPPVVADLYFAKIWLASRFVAPGCEPVCCDGNAPLPFARGAFRFAMCADAFMYIWTKRQMVSEMARLIDDEGPGAIAITHTHNERVWSPSLGQALPPEGYAGLFESLEPRLYAEGGLLDDVVAGGPLDLSRQDGADVLDADPALAIVASRSAEVFRPHPLRTEPTARGELRINPLYAEEPAGAPDGAPSIGDAASVTRFRLRFPSPEYEDEFGACRRYLEEEVTVNRTTLDAVAAGTRTEPVLELLRRRVVLEMPERYF